MDPDDFRAASLVAAMSRTEKLRLIHGDSRYQPGQYPRGAGGFVAGVPRLGVPDLYFVDGSVGIGNNTGESTGLPSAMASAASWDLELAYDYGQVLGRDMRAHGVNVHLGGNVNLVGREPRNGRAFETKGEDPILAGRINAAHVRGTQDQHVIAGIKHFALNNQESDRMSVDVRIDERAARETDLLAFEIGVTEGHVQSVMAAYNRVNGSWSSQSPGLLTEVLKRDWGFRGFVLSDWNGTHDCAASANAGLDLEMPADAWFRGMDAALRSGQVSGARLDEMVRRIVRAIFASGLADDPVVPGVPNIAAQLLTAQEVAEQGSVLLKNNGVLPLSRNVQSIAVIGPHADIGVLSGGGSAEVIPFGGCAWVESYQGIMPVRWLPSSPLAAIRAKVPSASVQFEAGWDVARAAALAAASDVAIVFAAQWSSEGFDRPTLDFSSLVPPSTPPDQDGLIQAVGTANARTVVVLEGPGAQRMPWLSSVAAVLEVWYPGQRGADAIGNLLFGDVNPSGKLPVTFPKNEGDLPRPLIADGPRLDYVEGLETGYRWFDAQGIEPLFPFGFGLSYTTFQLRNPMVRVVGPARFEIRVDVQNTGTRTGAEVVQVYVSMPASLGEPPRRLVGWSKLRLAPAELQTATIVVDNDSAAHPLAFWDVEAHSWKVLPGDYGIYVGTSSRDLMLAGTVQL